MKCETKLKVAYVVIGILLIACAGVSYYLYTYNQSTTALTTSLLQGYWLYKNDTYLLIDGDLVQILYLGAADKKPVEYLHSSQSKISYRSSTPDSVYKFRMSLSDKVHSSSTLNIGTELIIELFPIVGFIIMYDRSSNQEVARLIKDNEMSMVHFATN
jgi:hypothetical protein